MKTRAHKIKQKIRTHSACYTLSIAKLPSGKKVHITKTLSQSDCPYGQFLLLEYRNPGPCGLIGSLLRVSQLVVKWTTFDSGV